MVPVVILQNVAVDVIDRIVDVAAGRALHPGLLNLKEHLIPSGIGISKTVLREPPLRHI